MEAVASGAKNLPFGNPENTDAKTKYDANDENYVRKLEAKIASLEKARKKEKSGTEQHIAFLESRLDEANRLAKFLNGKKTKMTIEKQQLEERAKVLEEELIRLREEEQAKGNSDAPASSEPAKGETNSSQETMTDEQSVPEGNKDEGTAEEAAIPVRDVPPATMTTSDPSEVEKLVKEISELESRLVIANKVAEYLKKTVADANEKNRIGDEKALELEKQVEGLKVQFSGYEEELNNKKFKLAESKRILQFASSNLQTIKKEKAEMEEEHEEEMEAKDMELEKTKKQLETAQTALTRTQEEKAQLEGTLADVEFKLQESNRVCKYMQDTAVRLGEDKQSLKARVEALESELNETREALSSKTEEWESISSRVGEQDSTVAELLNKVEDYESQIAVSKKTLDFLQVNLSNAERETQASRAEAAKSMEDLLSSKCKVEDLENDVRSKNFKLAESKRILGFVEGKVKNVTEEKEQQAQEFKTELKDTQNKLTETKRILSFVKDKLTRDVEHYKEKTEENEKEADEFKSELTDSTSKAEYLQDIVVRVGKEKEDLEAKNKDLTKEISRLTNLCETQGSKLHETETSAKAHEANAIGLAKQLADLEGRMQVTDQLVEYLENEWRMALVKLEE